MKNTSYLLTVVLTFAAHTWVTAQLSVAGSFRGYYTFGINAGWSYQTSDVRAAKGGFGFGATLARNIYYRQGAALTFDLRGRLLYARQYGLDPFRTYDILGNTAIDGSRGQGLDYLSYPAQLGEPRGFAFLNHRTDLGELGLEAVFTLNRLRERTGVILSLFGGAGLSGYRVAVDQAGDSGQPYYEGYAALKDQVGSAQARSELRGQILDGNYETRGDGFDNTPVKIGFMPSLGVELGYQLSPRFSAHIGHRVTFSGTNALDGQRLEDNRSDIYHYTFFGLRWRIDRDRPNQADARAPEIDILSPGANPFTTGDLRGGQVRADIKYVSNPANIRIYVNGQEHRFDYQNSRLQTEAPLRPGRNEVTISAHNDAGTARETVIIIYQTAIDNPPPPPANVKRPRVAFDSPPGNKHRVSEPSFIVQARVEEVSNKADIEFTQNGAGRHFTFDSRAGVLRADIELHPGDNILRIRARNEAGNEEAVTTLIYEQRRQGPSVQITEPSRNDITVNEAQMRLRATVKRVDRRENLSLYINGRENRNFEFDVSREQLQVDLPLEQGLNRIELRAETRDGSDQDELRVTYQPPAQKNPPTVRFTRPGQPNNTSTKATADIEAEVTFINNKNQLTLTLNNQSLSNFTFNAATGKISATVNLVMGNNEIALKARNNDGNQEDKVVITRMDKPGGLQLPPRITIQQPANGNTVQTPTIAVKAKIERIGQRNDITFTVNGKRIYDFDFTSGNTEFSANVTLETDNNTIRIQANNSAGADDKQVNVTYKPAQPKPEANFLRPAKSNTSTNESPTPIVVSVKHVEKKENIRLNVNKKAVTDFTYDTQSGEVKANVVLNKGNNTLMVVATNEAGTAQASTIISFIPSVKRPPVIDISSVSQPVANPLYPNNANSTVIASIKNVTKKDQITFIVNGNAVTNFSFDVKTGIFEGIAPLNRGANAIVIKATNSDGMDEEQRTINF